MDHAARTDRRGHQTAGEIAPAAAQPSGGLRDQRPEAGELTSLVQAMRDGPAAVSQRRALRQLFGPAARLPPGAASIQAMAEPSTEAAQSLPDAPTRGAALPADLKSGVESLGGVAMDGVRVHYDSPRPSGMGAMAYAQGLDIHLGPGQERHLPHEAWHVVQQAQGRVSPTAQLPGGGSLNTDEGLEREADTMGAQAMALRPAMGGDGEAAPGGADLNPPAETAQATAQAMAPPDAFRRQVEAVFGGKRGDGVVQRAWAQVSADLFQWDTVYEGKQWYYTPSTDRYSFKIVDKKSVVLEAHTVFDVDIEGAEDKEAAKAELYSEIEKMQGKPLKYQFYFSDHDFHTITACSVLEAVTRPELIHCLDYLREEDPAGLELACAAVMGGAFKSGMADVAIGTAFRAAMSNAHFRKEGNRCSVGGESFVKEGASYKAALSATNSPVILQALNSAIWAGLGHEVEGALTPGTSVGGKEGKEGKEELKKAAPSTGSGGSVFNFPKTKEVGNFLIWFTNRVRSEEERTRAEVAVATFRKTIATLTPEDLVRVVTTEMDVNFREALVAKDIGIGSTKESGRKEALAKEQVRSEKIAKSLTEETLVAYCNAVVVRWGLFLKQQVVVVFDSAVLTTVYGKTPADKEATPEALMSQTEKGLPAKPSALINLDSDDILTTLAHELAHVIGFNPTGCEGSGHFTSSASYEDAEGKFGSKLLFDAYYFETLFKRLKK